jgi:hypothetical protein
MEKYLAPSIIGYINKIEWMWPVHIFVTGVPTIEHWYCVIVMFFFFHHFIRGGSASFVLGGIPKHCMKVVY